MSPVKVDPTALGVLGSEPIDWDRVVANTGLVGRIVRIVKDRPGYCDEDPEDLFQDGLLGLARAIQKFDPSRGFALSTYADSWIRQSIQRGMLARQGARSAKAGRDAIHISMDAPQGTTDDGQEVGSLANYLPSQWDDPADTATSAVLAESLTQFELDALLTRNASEVGRRHGVSLQTVLNCRAALRRRLQESVA